MKNKYEVRGAETAIFVNHRNGTISEVLIDTEDLPILLAAHGSLTCPPNGYPYIDKKLLTRMLMGDPPQSDRTYVVDHIHHDVLKNRVSFDLRWLDHSDNSKNVAEHIRRRLKWSPWKYREFPNAVYHPRSVWNDRRLTPLPPEPELIELMGLA